MVEIAALSAAAAAAELDRLAAAAGTTLSKPEVEALYAVLLGSTAQAEAAPYPLLAAAVGLAGTAEHSHVEALPPRARVALRLLRTGNAEAAWAVLVDNATGVVPRVYRCATSSGAERTEWPLPLLTTVEPPWVYAELPGFRDPRYAVADSVYEIGDGIRLRAHVDEVVTGRHPRLAGWAALDVLQTEPDEVVAVIAVCGQDEVVWPGIRVRRADLVGGSRDTLRRRAWAGWTAELAPAVLTGSGERALFLELTHDGFTRRVRLGRSRSELAGHAVGSAICRRPHTTLAEVAGGWSLQLGR